jgi:ABC-type nitrate/sulfonate/bicarbonate transport system substrate-binding protein
MHSTPTRVRRIRPIATALITIAAIALAGCATPESAPADGKPASKDIVFQPSTESLAVINQLYGFANDSFAKAGLNVTYNPVISNASQATQAVATGAADIAIVGTTGVLPGVATGMDIVSVATITKGSTTQITLRDEVIKKLGIKPDDPLKKRIAALKGLTLALPAPGSLTDLTVREMLRLYHLDADKDTVIRPLADPTALVTAMREGQVDGFAFSAPTSVQPVTDGYASVWISLAEVPEYKQLPFIDVVTSRKFLQNNREAVIEFLKVLKKSADAIEKDSDAVAEVIKKKYFADLDPNLWKLAWDFSYGTATHGFVPEKSGFDVLLKIINNQTDQPVDVKFSDVYDLSLLKELE